MANDLSERRTCCSWWWWRVLTLPSMYTKTCLKKLSASPQQRLIDTITTVRTRHIFRRYVIYKRGNIIITSRTKQKSITNMMLRKCVCVTQI